MNLHTVNKSSWQHSTLETAVNAASAGDTILLIEEGVYCALPQAADAFTPTLQARSITLAALSEDISARGLDKQISGKVSVINYDEFVTLVTSHECCIAWT